MRLILIFLIVIITIACYSQEVYRVNSIEIEGNKVTNRATVLRELSFHIGDSLTLKEFNEKLKQSELNIGSQWLFNFVDIVPIYKQYEIDVNIEVIERWYVWPYPILEISERNFNVWWDDFQSSNYQDFSRFNYGAFESGKIIILLPS